MRARPSRWWIPAVPVAIGLMLASAGYRVQDLWYAKGEHRETSRVDAGEWARATWAYDDAHGETTRTFSVRFSGWGESSRDFTARFGDEIALPEGLVARQVRLDFRAEPSQAMRYCNLTLIDDRGREYGIGLRETALGDSDPCVPLDWPGPPVPITRDEKRGVVPFDGEPRPAEWTVTPAIAVPEDARLVELRLSYEPPRYLTLRLPH